MRAVGERIERELEKGPDVGPPRLLVTGKESSESGTRSEPENAGSRIVIDDQIARSSKELARQAFEMVLEMSRHHAQPHRVAGLTNPRENRAVVRT